ncbi:retinitis pigmentosa GTPase regulator b isoform X1 [Megalobrama amblycephala]|uniref:retinitis pigmentosa GTPase regulator b isoform X1 n=1 Tax=Megalobrama amblycephala TaxID=75352 RepID=UPI002014412D|nr:retinitis pigmentosa GTPase regulator b isoform X1 [Megalobrama amblycephala]
MAGETEDEIPESGAVFTFGKSKFADNAPSKFWLKNDVPLRISCGDEHTALVTENGKLFMFGSNNWGQLGLGTKSTVNKPTCVKALKSESVKLAACGRTHTLVYTSRGNLYASGGNNEGQLGLGDCDDRASFHLVDFFSKHGPIKMLAAGSNTSAALTQDGRLYMWGDNSEGQIGLGKESNALTPQEVSVGKRVSWVSCGYYHSAFVTVDGALFTFGEKDSGKLGLSTEKLANHKVPQQVTNIPDKVVQVSCGGGHTVALTEHGVYSFGLGQFGQLGHGTFIFESRLPRVVEHFRRGRVKHVECGENHTALITESGLLYTFGDGRHGKLGLGEENFTNQFRPTLCTRFLYYHVHFVTCGGCHMLVLAKPRAERLEDLILEEDDVTEDYFEKSCTELLGDTHIQTTLNRSLSARVRRRERERSPDQFGQMFRTLPALGGNQLSATSLSVPSQIRHSHRKQPGKIPHNTLKIPGKRVKSLDDRSSVEDTESVKDLGETTDLLNLTHIIKMDPSDKTLTLSPMEKKKVKVVKEHGKEKGRHSDPAPYSKRAELSARKALPTELLRSPSGSSVVGDSLGSGTPHKSPKRHGHDKENVLIALENRKPAYHQAGESKTRLGMDISRAESKHTEVIKSKDKVKKESTGKAQPNQEAESEKLAQKSKGRTKPNQEGAGKAKPKDRPLEVRSQPQQVVGKEKEVKMKPIIVVEHHLEQTTHKDQDPTGKKISKEVLPKARGVKGETNAAKTENKNLVPQSKKSDSKKDSKSGKTIQEISTTSQQSCQEDVSAKKTKKSRAEQSQLLVEDKLKNTKKGPTIVSEAASKSESASESEQMKENPLIKVTSFLQDVAMGSPACLLGESAVSQFLSQSTPRKMPKPLSKQRTLSDVSSLSESDEVSRQEETREARRTAVTIDIKTEAGSSDGDLERSSIESKTEAHSEVGTYRRSEEEGGEESDEEEEEESKGLLNRKDESEEESESKTLDNVANDDDSEVDNDTTIKASSEDEESEEEQEKSKSEATEDVESEAEEEESDGIEDEEEETSEISRKSEEESGAEKGESKQSEVEETESKSERSKDESDEENEESEEKDSEDEEENDVESDSAEEDEDSKKISEEEEEDSEKLESETEDEGDEDGDKTSEEDSEKQESETEDEGNEDGDKTSEEEEEDSENLEGETEDEGDEDGDKTSEEEEEDSEKQESETEDEGDEDGDKTSEEDSEKQESETEDDNEVEEEEESEEIKEDEEEGESNEEEATSQNDEEEEETSKEESENEEEDEQESKDEEEEEQESGDEEEEEQESEDKEEEEQESEDEEEEEQKSEDEKEEEQKSEDEEEEEEESKGDEEDDEEAEEEAEEEESEEKEEMEEAEDEEGEEEDKQEDQEESDEEEEEEKEKAKRKPEKASESIKQKSNVKTTKQQTKAKRARAQKHQSDDESQEPQQFWDDVLPQYLNLK